jgi:hypothetical protein
MQLKIEVKQDGKRWFTIYQTTSLLRDEIAQLVNALLIKVLKQEEG